MTRILDVLLDLTLFPACCRVTELGLEQIMTDHGEEAGVDGSGLAAPDLFHGGAHIVVNPPARHAAQHSERRIMSLEPQNGRASRRKKVWQDGLNMVVAVNCK